MIPYALYLHNTCQQHTNIVTNSTGSDLMMYAEWTSTIVVRCCDTPRNLLNLVLNIGQNTIYDRVW